MLELRANWAPWEALPEDADKDGKRKEVGLPDLPSVVLRLEAVRRGVSFIEGIVGSKKRKIMLDTGSSVNLLRKDYTEG